MKIGKEQRTTVFDVRGELENLMDDDVLVVTTDYDTTIIMQDEYSNVYIAITSQDIVKIFRNIEDLIEWSQGDVVLKIENVKVKDLEITW